MVERMGMTSVSEARPKPDKSCIAQTRLTGYGIEACVDKTIPCIRRKKPMALKTLEHKKSPERGLKKFGSDLLSHMTLCSIIGDEELNCRVRYGIGCTLFSMAAKKYELSGKKEVSFLFEKQDSRAISTGQLHTSRRFHLQPINEVVFLCPYRIASGRTYLEAGFPLRCFQRLSLPHIATLPCRWRDNRSTRGASIPVLSY